MPNIKLQPIKIKVAKEAPMFVLFSLKGHVRPEFQWACDTMDRGQPEGKQLLSRSQALTPEDALEKARAWCREKGIYGE